MGYNDRGGDRGGRRFGGGGRGGGYARRDSGPRQMHSAVCADCGNNCEVPFRPTGDKPVYCSNCFEKHDSGGARGSDRGSRGSRDFGGRSDESTKKIMDQLSKLNDKLDKLLSVLTPNAPLTVKKAETTKPKKEKETKPENAKVKDLTPDKVAQEVVDKPIAE